MATVTLAPFDDASKRKLLAAVAGRGQASGLEAAAKILVGMADSATRVVGTNTIRDAAAALVEKAARIRAAADADIADLQSQSQ